MKSVYQNLATLNQVQGDNRQVGQVRPIINEKGKSMKNYIYKGNSEIQEIGGKSVIFVKDKEYTLDENAKVVKKLVALGLLKESNKTQAPKKGGK